MPDISKCTGDGCPVRKKCCHFTCPAGEWQAWSDFHAELLQGSKNGCEYFKAIQEEGK
jgi:hypothetical protein